MAARGALKEYVNQGMAFFPYPAVFGFTLVVFLLNIKSPVIPTQFKDFHITGALII
jgi:hypothetical protein